MNGHVIIPSYRSSVITIIRFCEHFVIGGRYLNILQNLNIYLKSLSVAEQRNVYYQHDGAPPCRGQLINNFLQDTFYDQWPPRSPDLAVLYYFIWIYETTIEENMQKIRNAFRNLPR